MVLNRLKRKGKMMAEQFKNDKNLLIIKLDWRECVNITDSWGLADCCGQNSSEEDLYYIALLDQFYCKPCFDAWYSGVKRTKCELEKENQNFMKVKNKLKDLGTWQM